MKVEGVSKLIDSELTHKAYDKIIIFAIHTSVIEGLRDRLWGYNPVTLYGKDSTLQRERNIEVFQKDPKCKIAVCNILAAGTAINLTAASQVFFAEQDWVPGNNAQAIKRAHRIGSRKTVFVRVCSMEDSLDERINELLKEKSESICLTFDN